MAPSDAGRPLPGLRLCAVEDVADPGSLGFRFREGEAQFVGFVVRVGDRLTGYVDRCPHAGWPLALAGDRFLTRDGAHILCGAHGALFRPEDGVCVAGPCLGQALAPWPIEVREGQVFTA